MTVDQRIPTIARRRGGRPPAAQAGEVDARLLDAAGTLFLRQGFDGTSCDQVAALAGAGKASIYARYANKEELFAAVVRRTVESTVAPAADLPWHRLVEERLAAAGHALLLHALRPEVVAFMRVVMTTAHRLPDLARMADRTGWEAGRARVAAAIVGDPAAAPAALVPALPLAGDFVDMVFAPQQMRALMGDDPAALAAAAPARVDAAVALLAAAGRLAPWS